MTVIGPVWTRNRRAVPRTGHAGQGHWGAVWR